MSLPHENDPNLNAAETSSAEMANDFSAAEIGSQPDDLSAGDATAEMALEQVVVNFQTIDSGALDAEISGDAPPDKYREINRKAKRGIKTMMGRQVILQGLTFGGGIVLARILDPATFGFYTIITFLVTVFGMLGNFGLAPSLVQRRGEIEERDLRIAFTMQQGLITLVVIALMISAPFLVSIYPAAPDSAALMLRAMAFTLYLTSWRTMSKLQLERNMSFDKIARVEIVETLIYQALAVVLALLGWGIWSFIVAALVRGAVGTLLSFLYAPWQVRFAYDHQIAMGLLRFGLPFQAEAITHSASAWATPLLVGTFIGPQAVGFLTFASSNGRKPLILAESFISVSFPHFSRLQDDLPEVERILVRYLTYLLLAAGLWSAILVVAGGPLVELIYGSKWRPSEHALVIFSVAMSTDVVMRLVSVALTALGRVKIAWSRTATRTAAQVLLSLPALYFFGFNGMPFSYLVAMTITMPFLFTALGEGAMKRVMGPVIWIALPWIVSCACGLVAMRFSMPVVTSLSNLTEQIASVMFSLLLVGLSYGLAGFYLSPVWLRNNLIQRRKQMFNF